MPSSRPEPRAAGRRRLLRAGLAAGGGAWLAGVPLCAAALGPDELAARLLEGGVVIAFRHALAPGTFDPPGFTLDDCSSQRNLSDPGRAQARQIGAWFKARGLRPARVRSSPWCRCLDTAQLAFGTAEAWHALGSPYGARDSSNAENLAALCQALAEASQQPGRFQAWGTHMFVLSDLGLGGASSG